MNEADQGPARRDLLLWGLASCCFVPTAGHADEADLPQKDDRLVIEGGANDGKLASVDNVTVAGGLVSAVSMDRSDNKRTRSRFSKILLVRVEPEDIAAEYRPGTVEGIIALSAICTHQGCTINAWLADQKRLGCFCHGSQFFPAEGGGIAHGPARKRLPILAIAKGGDGLLLVAGEFVSKLGPPSSS